MSRLLALEWDAREVRVVVARRRANSVVIEQAFAELWRKPSEAGDAGDSPQAEASLGKRLGEMLAVHGVRRIDTLVAVGRSNIELRLLSLPPVPPEELPDVVRFQALKQFSSVGENWPIDFVPLDIPSSSQVNVLAAAIAPELVEQIRKTCSGAEVDPKRLVLRPYAAASLWQQHAAANGCVLMIDLLGEDADLSVLVDGQVGFIRTVRVPHGEEVVEQAKWLSGEAKRTMAAASNQLGGRRADRIVLCGEEEDYAELRKALEPLVNLPLELFDPFDGLTLEKGVADKLPPHRGRYAPLLGMVAEEAAGKLTGIDFLNPRKTPPPPNRRKLYGIVGGTAASVALLLSYFVWSQFSDYDQKLKELLVETAKVEADVKKLDRQVREAKTIDDFVAGDVTWLDELYHVSENFLPPEKAIVGNLSAIVQQSGGGTLSVEGNVKQSGDIDLLEQKLRSSLHRVSGSGSQYDPRQAQYPWQFKESITAPSAAEVTDAPAKPAKTANSAATTASPATDKKADNAADKPADKSTAKAGDTVSNGETQDSTDVAAKPSDSPAKEGAVTSEEKKSDGTEKRREDRPLGGPSSGSPGFGPGGGSRPGGGGRPDGGGRFDRGPRSDRRRPEGPSKSEGGSESKPETESPSKPPMEKNEQASNATNAESATQIAQTGGRS